MKKTRIVIAVFLALLIFVQIPVQVAAAVFPDSISEDEAPPNILAEVVENRDQYTKHFLMSDGSIMAAQYEYPVHFKDKDGKWIDYDNGMQETEAEEETAESSTEEPAYTDPVTEQETGVTISIETEPTAIVATDAMEPNKGSSAVRQNRSSATSEDDKTEYKNKKSDIDIRLAKKSKENNMVKVKMDGYKISWGFTDVNKSRAQFIENTNRLEGDDSFLVRKNLMSETLYENVFPNVDLQYFVTPEGVKENIILNNENARTDFEVQYKIKGLKAVQKDNWTIELQDKKGEIVSAIKAPFMTDAANARSTALNLTIKSQKKNQLIVGLSVDNDWIHSESREFPITIDPSMESS